MGYMRDLDEYTEQELLGELRARAKDQAEGKCDYCHNKAGVSMRESTGHPKASDGPCRFPERHAGMAPTTQLSSSLPLVNKMRVQEWHPGFPNDGEWIGSDWSNAMCGEAGEAANVVKKIRRLDGNMRGRASETDREVLREKLGEEIADVIIYADLLAQYYDIDIPWAIALKFNQTSVEYGFKERLRP